MFESFLIRAFAAGLGLALIAAPLGCFVVWRRMAYFGETIAQSSLLGIALSLLLQLNMTAGALGVVVIVAFLLLLLERQTVLPLDSLLGIMAHAALAIGVIAASLVRGAQLDLMGYLFGEILAVTTADLLWIYLGGAVVLAALVWQWRPLLAMSVHEELARAEGIDTERARAVLVLLLAFTIAIAIKIVGVLLMIAFLIMPAAAARPLAETPEQMALLAVILGMFGVVGGLFMSMSLDTPCGPSIVVVLTFTFVLSTLPALLRGRA